MSKRHDLTGRVFNRLTVVSYAGHGNRGRCAWLCRCECGENRIVEADLLKSSQVRSCGCHRFWDKINKTDGCWEWTACIGTHGYGEIHYNGRTEVAHRVSYIFEYGSIPEGLVIDHKCRNRKCVRPSHLEAVTQKVNMERSFNPNRLKTHCPYGHEYTRENTYKYSTQGRKCRTCASIYKKNKTRKKNDTNWNGSRDNGRQTDVRFTASSS